MSTWQGWLYVAFVIDAYAKRIVGWRASSSMTTDFVLDALEQAVYDRRPTPSEELVHHSDRRSQYVSIRYSDRLSEAGINPSVGSTGSAYDNALAETINGLYKTEVIHRRALGKPRPPWNWPPWNGCLGSTINAWNRSETSRRQKPKKGTIDDLQHALRNLFYFNQTASAIPGVIQSSDHATKAIKDENIVVDGVVPSSDVTGAISTVEHGPSSKTAQAGKATDSGDPSRQL